MPKVMVIAALPWTGDEVSSAWQTAHTDDQGLQLPPPAYLPSIYIHLAPYHPVLCYPRGLQHLLPSIANVMYLAWHLVQVGLGFSYGEKKSQKQPLTHGTPKGPFAKISGVQCKKGFLAHQARGLLLTFFFLHPKAIPDWASSQARHTSAATGARRQQRSAEVAQHRVAGGLECKMGRATAAGTGLR